MSTKAYILFIVLLTTVSGGVYLYSYDLGSTDGYEKGYSIGNFDGYNIGREEGYNLGHTDGYDEGNSSGYLVGFSDGNDNGYKIGFKQGKIEGNQTGYTNGHYEGYNLGYIVGNTTGYSIGYIKGNITGYLEGNLLGNVTGFNIGYLLGVKDGAGTGYTIRNPTYSEIINFLWHDQTDKNEYIDDIYVCRHFSSDVIRHAFEDGYRGFYVYLSFGNNAHAIVGFNTTDKGMIYFEPQNDDRVYPVVGNVYWDRTIYIPPLYDDTIKEILIIG